MKWLSRLLPGRLRTREVLVDDERMRLLAGVSDNDPCLRAVLDLQQETMEREFYAAIDFNRPDTEKLRACEGMRVAFYGLQRLEQELHAAREWRAAQEERRKL